MALVGSSYQSGSDVGDALIVTLLCPGIKSSDSSDTEPRIQRSALDVACCGNEYGGISM
jgi:hypothetical protein